MRFQKAGGGTAAVDHVGTFLGLLFAAGFPEVLELVEDRRGKGSGNRLAGQHLTDPVGVGLVENVVYVSGTHQQFLRSQGQFTTPVALTKPGEAESENEVHVGPGPGGCRRLPRLLPSHPFDPGLGAFAKGSKPTAEATQTFVGRLAGET